MIAMLLQTLVWTGVLIAAVLLLRRPVTRHFGPEVAYALWLIPLARVVLPPVTLPAWMAPRPAALAPVPLPPEPLAPTAPLAEPVQLSAAAEMPLPPAPLPPADAPAAGFDLLAALAAAPLLEAALLVWLAGAGVTLWRRFAAYFALRAALLEEGREVGRAPGGWGGLQGKIRLIETPATPAPIAFGVLDPVIALPPGFMALHDRAARDLALAHELAHHRAGDLLVNVLVQPLFALHWFNPLGRYGWLALRRDQEAACDARVMAARPPQDRAVYAALIARFAAAPGATHTAALTAPMACPVLGETSIIHRLRSLAMSDLSPRRRWAGRALLGAGLLALPLTASISYAANEAAPPPPAPPAAPEAPQAPEAPSAPSAPTAPEAPTPPQPPAPPVVVLIDRDGAAPAGNTQVTEHVWRNPDGTEKRVRIVFSSAEQQAQVERILEGSRRMDQAEREELRATLREGLAEAERLRAEMPRFIEEALIASQQARAAAPRVMVLRHCTDAFRGEGEVITGKDGQQTIMICQPRVAASARLGLEQARAEIAADTDIPEATRKQLLRTLDAQIARWKDKEG